MSAKQEALAPTGFLTYSFVRSFNHLFIRPSNFHMLRGQVSFSDRCTDYSFLSSRAHCWWPARVFLSSACRKFSHMWKSHLLVKRIILPSTVEIKNTWICTSLPSFYSRDAYHNEAQGQFYCYFFTVNKSDIITIFLHFLQISFSSKRITHCAMLYSTTRAMCSPLK
jgi:hypothetical protein